ncbi:MAG: hypothetical protein KBA58_05060 [Methanomassiliicoccales archaeon]|nr:hypothetical protein [Methanomassiliicoccales archaeon]
MLAHHPLCGRFDDHLLNIRGRKVCRGCVTVYPTFVVIMVLLFMGRPEFMAAFVASLVSFTFQLLRFLIPGRGWSIFFNTVLGSSLALAAYSAIVCPPDLRLFVYPFIVTVIVVFEFLKGRRMLRRCKECTSRASYPHCARGPPMSED